MAWWGHVWRGVGGEAEVGRLGGVGTCGEEVVRWGTGKWNVAAFASLTLPSLSPLSSLSALSFLPSAAPAASAASAASAFLSLSPDPARFLRSQLLPTCALSSCKRSAARVVLWRAFSAYTTAHISLDLDHPRSPIFVPDFPAPGTFSRSRSRSRSRSFHSFNLDLDHFSLSIFSTLSTFLFPLFSLSPGFPLFDFQAFHSVISRHSTF